MKYYAEVTRYEAPPVQSRHDVTDKVTVYSHHANQFLARQTKRCQIGRENLISHSNVLHFETGFVTFICRYVVVIGAKERKKDKTMVNPFPTSSEGTCE